jgi:hypothetical protein
MSIGKVINVGSERDTFVVVRLDELVEMLRHSHLSTLKVLKMAGFNVLDCQEGTPDWLEFFMHTEDDNGMTLEQWKIEIEEE